MSFFLNIHDEIIKPGLGFVDPCKPRFEAGCRGSLFSYGRKAVYKFGASDERHQDLRGNNLVMWNAIQFLAQNGFEELASSAELRAKTTV